MHKVGTEAKPVTYRQIIGWTVARCWVLLTWHLTLLNGLNFCSFCCLRELGPPLLFPYWHRALDTNIVYPLDYSLTYFPKDLVEKSSLVKIPAGKIRGKSPWLGFLIQKSPQPQNRAFQAGQTLDSVPYYLICSVSLNTLSNLSETLPLYSYSLWRVNRTVYVKYLAGGLAWL